MKVMAQIAMVMNLDKCIGCHTCSVTCKQVWTNREGTEYIWFNNVETRPGVGYPRGWEDQKKWKGGWKRTATGRLVPRQGGRVASLAKIFANPTQPTMQDYYEPWTYEYDKLLQAPANSRAIPTARAKSTITGEHIDKPEWGPNWDDDLGGSMETLDQDPVLHQMNLQVAKTIEDAYMFYLPRICEHCLNPTCVSACPSGAMYKRTEDGIVLVDQNQCRGWRMCVSACPYKKVYFNHNTGKAEKCTLCYPRLEVGQPTICSETCVGRLRYLGVLLYDADRVTWAASQEDERDLYRAQREILLDPNDPQVVAQAQAKKLATKVMICPILRAALGMLDSVFTIIPDASVGFLGFQRNEKTAEAEFFYAKLPRDAKNRLAIIIDPMFATGGTAIDAVKFLRENGIKQIKFISIIAAPEGLKRFSEVYPDVEVYTAAIDERLNDKNYIVPGLGDAGDRVFNTL